MEAADVEPLVIKMAQIAGAAHRASAVQHGDGESVDAKAGVAEGDEGWIDAYMGSSKFYRISHNNNSMHPSRSEQKRKTKCATYP